MKNENSNEKMVEEANNEISSGKSSQNIEKTENLTQKIQNIEKLQKKSRRYATPKNSKL